ncbi:MAG TPA: serine/threonine-protein kinase [Streptosporangiaceae bacterium]
MNGENRPAIGDFPAGSRIAGYQIQELIGRGGMAVVYRASDVRLDRLVALKVLAPDLTRDSAFRQRFIRESRSGASVDHPNVIPVFEAGEAEGVLFIAMRYVAGRDVRALIDREGPLRPSRVVSIVTQIASALDTAHAHGLVHRDVKPANMLLGTVATGSAPDHVYLSDFGLSKLSVSAISLTGTGQFLGTIDYMSPEQVEGRAIDGRTDLYALACATFEMLTGRPPFQRDQDLAVMWAQVSAPPPSARQLRRELSPEVDRVIAKALAKAPGDRHATCLEFAAGLSDACAIRPGQSQIPPATELAAAVPPQAAAHPPLSPATPGYEATITEAVRPVSAMSPGQYSSGPPGRTNQLREGSGYQQPPYRGTPPRRRSRALPITLSILAVVIMAGIGALVLHSRSNGAHTPPTTPVTASGSASPSQQASQSSSPPVLTSPDSVVTAYYDAVNNHDYATAYRLNNAAHNKSYPAFKQGFTGTRHVYLTITGVSGDLVSFDLRAVQTDGTVKTYTGTYTVRNGKIALASVTQTG